jgi:cyclic beta-1,2-glucan synthetase
MPGTRATPRRAGLGPGRARLRLIGLDTSPLHGELLGVERLEERARALAAGFTPFARPAARAPALCAACPTTRACSVMRYRILAGDVRRGEPISPAAEWLLDNFHLVEGEIREIRHHLPTRYYRELPKLRHARARRTARVYGMAVELLRYSDARLDARRAPPPPPEPSSSTPFRPSRP